MPNCSLLYLDFNDMINWEKKVVFETTSMAIKIMIIKTHK